MKLKTLLNILKEGQTSEEELGKKMMLEGWEIKIKYKNSCIELKSPKGTETVIMGKQADRLFNKVIYGVDDKSYILGSLRESLITEGVYDPGIFKAIFLLGGPGSGKSYVLNQLFGMTSKLTFSRHGLKLVNPDPAFEALLKKANINPKDLDKMNQDDSDNYAKTVDPLRNRAKGIEKNMEDNFINGRLGMVLEGTGKTLDNVKNLKTRLESLGYDCFLIFVNTALETAKKRNQQRSRTIPEDLLVSMWNATQRNLGDLQSEFGATNTIIVDNSDDNALPSHISKSVDSFMKTPIRNPIGKEWMKTQLTNKNRNV